MRYYHPGGPCAERREDELLQQIVELKPSRLVFDSIDDLHSVLGDAERVRDHVLVLATMFNASGTTSLVMHELRGGGSAPQQDDSHLARSVLRLTLGEVGGRQRRFVAVTKFSGSDHSKTLQEYEIDGRGLRVLGAAVPETALAPLACGAAT